ncbi:MAG: hypothetical protein ACRDK5_08725 [Solirubrobacterales bacterium]
MLVGIALSLPACGPDDNGAESGTTAPVVETGPASLPPAATETSSEEHLDEGQGAGEASPEAPAVGPATGELPGTDEEVVTQTVRFYIDALDRHDASLVCELLEPGALRLSELPVRRGGCASSLAASIGHRPPGGTPAWRRTTIAEITAVSVEGGGARATATVTHRFADRKYTSIEEDVIYLRPEGERWLLAKPSGTLFRAVGYPEPPLKAFTPP